MTHELTLKLLSAFGPARHSKREAGEEATGERGAGDDEPAPWVPVVTAFDIARVTIAQARLQDEGIPTRLRREAVSSALPLTVGIIGRIDVMVPESMLEQANLILDDAVESEIDEDETES
jgi:hypothetical protein